MNTQSAAAMASTASEVDQSCLQKLLDNASAFITQNRFTDAQPLLEEAITMVPRSLELRLTTALVYLQSGATTKAEAHLRAALRIKTDCTEALHNLALLMTSLGRFEDAKKYLHKLLLIDDRNVDVYNDLAVIEGESGNAAAAERAFVTGMRLPGANKKIFQNYLDFCIQTGNRAGYDEAAMNYDNRWHSRPPVKWPIDAEREHS